MQPQFSLAGHNPWHQGNKYISPEYESMNPHYGAKSEDDGPVWSLSQPLPRVVRPGMRRGILPEDREEDNTADPRAGQSEGRTEQEAMDAQEGRTDTGPQRDTTAEDQEGEFLNTWCKIRHYMREPLAEWLGVTVAVSLGLGASLSWVTSQGQAGSFVSQCVTWGFGFMLAIYMTGGVSGGHLNPAITISMSVWRGFPAKKCVTYVLAQLLGAITAGGIVYAIYHDAIVLTAAQNKVDQNASPAAQAMFTQPKSFVSPATAFFNEFFGSAILMGTILALGDDTNAPPGAGMQAFIVGILITILCLAFGYNTGGCFNGARDFGPRLVAVMAGWGGHLFREYHAWWVWGPWVADIFGMLFGAFIYDLMIFTGGESPINYPPRRRKRGLLVKEINLRRTLGLGRDKVGDLENAANKYSSGS
ncbi:aquaporin [Aspergillus campestris IBT 28561]|uniref:Aquaporin n=1 Tax=Aspergillus campestris (strain IBT 28561) TaxID=1392248 RepID=A0A2I1D061_ASPC2|nr:aquaporin [Aspergillus campestris IBT 28561]PKY03256.1 aquaporin [Aspergillus campestris IBT 28561]